MDKCYGLFRSQREAKECYAALCHKHQLCSHTLGAKTRKGSCFNVQLGRCLGVCQGSEPLDDYHQRLECVLASLKHALWPYDSMIACVEHDKDQKLMQVHFIDQWRYIGSQKIKKISDLVFPTIDQSGVFDRDQYRIIKQFLSQSSDALTVIEADVATDFDQGKVTA